jgi:arsenate reductase (thioredoxin)
MKSTFYLILSILPFLWSCSFESKQKSTIEETSNQIVKVSVIKTENTNPMSMYAPLSDYIDGLLLDMDAIPRDRKNQLKKIALYIQTKKQSNEQANLIYICTHNSRRSHLSQIWSATAAQYYGVGDNIHNYSGGTEATAFNPRAVSAVERAGFIVKNPGGENPHYRVLFAEHGTEIECFSKKYDDTANPTENFAAIMTCSDADKNCPYIPGASLRVPIPYEDPKNSDGSENETSVYDERCRQIAIEMFYMMSQVKG